MKLNMENEPRASAKLATRFWNEAGSAAKAVRASR